MEQPLFSLAYTSVRPHIIERVFNLWNERSTLKRHEWCLGIDDGNIECLKAAENLKNVSPHIKIAINKGPKTCVAGWNAAAEITSGKVIIAVADDFLPPYNWDGLLMSLEPKGWEDGEYVVKVEDGYVHNIFVLSILTRKRYEKFGYLFYPGYLSLFCDTEFGEVAIRDGVVINAEHLLFEHLHPDCHKRERDNIDLVHASNERWKAGEMLFNLRKAKGFPIDAGPLAEKYKNVNISQPKNDKYIAYMQVIKDDLCLIDVCLRLAEQGIKDFAFCQPDAYWSGEPVEEEHKNEIALVIEKLRSLNLTVHHKIFPVKEFQVKDDSRIKVETRVRNASLEWIRNLGYEHVLIVDGDELWFKDSFELIKQYVSKGCKVIGGYMVPVIGVPGYPVEGAKDLAVVYVHSSERFKSCRTPFTRYTIIYKPLMYHFTGTRKGMEDTIKKHRRGGHYDDPDYDFEGWIKDVLPNIKPGLQNAHMYRRYQIWPYVRDWRQEELASMPASVKPYLPIS